MHTRRRQYLLTGVTALSGLALFAYAVRSDEPVVLQHSRLDTSAGAYTLFTTIAYGE